jgi:hypothetical protein
VLLLYVYYTLLRYALQALIKLILLHIVLALVLRKC